MLDSTGRSETDSRAEQGIPRAVEVLAAGVALILLSPLMTASALATVLSSPGGALFRQARVGRDGRLFTLIKFRTMRIDDQGPRVTASRDSRITGVGRWLRKLKLDELPELWNVLRGDMSLVGPRPEVPRFVSMENPWWVQVLRERPGITHPITLRLKDEERLLEAVGDDPEIFYSDELLPFKLRAYVEYQEHRSAISDLKVLASTVLGLIGLSTSPPVELSEVRATTPNEGRSG